MLVKHQTHETMLEVMVAFLMMMMIIVIIIITASFKLEGFTLQLQVFGLC